MAWRSVLSFGLNFLKKIRQYPTLLHRFPKTFQVRIKPPAVYNSQSFIGKLFGFYRNTIAGTVRNSVIKNATHQRPNSLIRAYSGLAGSVHLRHSVINDRKTYFKTINEASKRNCYKFSNLFGWFNSYPTLPTINNSSSLVPDELIASGCNSAVWSAKVDDVTDVSYQNADEQMNELAVKVLYNYYASSDASNNSSSTIQHSTDQDLIQSNRLPSDWVLLNRQIQRECELRPQTDHPNIVPLMGHFIDRAPRGRTSSNAKTESDNGYVYDRSRSRSPLQPCMESSAEYYSSITSDPQKIWAGAESFPEGFGGQPLTAYLVMPKFEATLDDLIKGTWPHSNHATSHHQLAGPNASHDIFKPKSLPEQPTSQTLSTTKPHALPVPVDDAISILAQLFEAISELEAHGIAHRDIKPNNILLRERSVSSAQQASVNSARKAFWNHRIPDHVKNQLDWLNDSEVSINNSRIHAAITDFGCAIRTRNEYSSLPYLERFFAGLNSEADSNVGILDHSGNTALLAPEIASRSNTPLKPSDYERADIWAVATLTYPLFGLPNPFTTGALSSKTYSERELPKFPPNTPGIVRWLVSECLKRRPNSRPAAGFVADVLHVWSLLRRLNRILVRQTENSRTLKETKSDLIDEQKNVTERDGFEKSMMDDIEEICARDGGDLSVQDRLGHLLNMFWASDWITGAARAPQGIRSNFYSRVTPTRLLICLKTVYEQEYSQSSEDAHAIYEAFRAFC